ncbi:IS21 family transposase [Lujinxingia vulgaris]|uniref:IS21 family transposase n=1 Tax=Lujinxingia vulgaris TaxID=2600176 RepID=A0A5C6XDY9_9DELT|nr:IS21 family transposase [Lujinxingia vulgaris]TXD37033.1 IS21 family transposase [Lujinxingia vulgaris]
MQDLHQKYPFVARFQGGNEMMTPDDVAAMVRLHMLGWGSRRIARELKISRNTVKRYLREGGYVAYKKPARKRTLQELEGWLRERFLLHKGNADVVRQELESKHDISVSLRTVQRAVAPFRQELVAEAKATVRFETPPGKQLQVDFGTIKVEVGGEPKSVQLCVLTLGYSRRTFVQAFGCQRLSQWLEAIESSFHHFGGVPQELLIDNASPLVKIHDVAQGRVEFTRGLEDFCRHWGVRPRACAPYRARTKGKDERMVQYVKRNAIAGRSFESWSALEAHLQWWMREVADKRIHDTVKERPIDRFEREEKQALRPPGEHPRYTARRELRRRVKSDATVEVDTNHYSVPWRHLGRTVEVIVTDEEVRLYLNNEPLATHRRGRGRDARIIEPGHLDGVVRGRQDLIDRALANTPAEPAPEREQRRYALLRPLSDYEAVVGGER